MLAKEVLRIQGKEAPPPTMVRVGLGLKGGVSTDKVEQILSRLLLQHPSLRASFAPSPLVFASERESRLKRFLRTSLFEPGLYIQKVTETTRIELKKMDFSSLNQAQYENSLVEFLGEEDVRALRDAESPRIRATLLTCPTRDHLLIVHIDRAVCDGVSLSILRKELTSLLVEPGAEAQGTGGDLGISHPAFAAWQAQMMRTTYFDNALAYWREQWIKFAYSRITFEDLPFGTRDASFHEPSFSTLNASFAHSECEHLRAFVRKYRITLFVLFYAALSALLSRYAQRTTVAIWAQFSNRVHSGTLNAIGDFSNSHLLGLEVSGDLSIAEFLRVASKTVIDAFAHQELPLSHLWHKLGCAPRFPDATVALDFRTVPGGSSNSGRNTHGLEVSPVPLPPSTARRFSNLGIYVLDDLRQITIAVEYWTSRFPQSAIERVTTELKEMVLFFIAKPETRLSTLPGMARLSNRDNGHMGDFVVFTANALPHVPNATASRDDETML